MKRFLSLTMILIIVTGCSALANDDLKWFKTLDEAIEYGIKEEELKKQDVIGEVKENGETFIFYKKKLDEGLGIGVASISEQNGQFAWYRSSQDVLVKNDNTENYSSEISWDTKTQSEKSFTVYTGIKKEQNFSINTPKGEVNPEIDKNTGIYFYIESRK